MQSQTSPHRKTRLASDYYYYQIHLNGPICLYTGYGKMMVVTKTKGVQSCEVVKEKRGVEIETCISSMCYLSSNHDPSTTAAIKDSEWTGQ